MTPRRRGRMEMTPLTAGAKAADDLAHRGREDVDAAHDQHVVGAADAAHPRRGAAAGAAAGVRADMVAAAEAQERRGALARDGCRRARPRRRPRADAAAPVSGSISSKWTKPRPEKCMPPCSSHSPQSETAMSPIPIASVTFAPQAASSCVRSAGSPPPGSPRDEEPRDARRRRGRCRASRRPLGEVERVGRGQRDGVGLSSLTAAISRSVLPGPTGMWQSPSACEGVERGAGDERAGAVGRDQPSPARDAGGGVGARRDRDPVGEVGRG